MLSFGKMSEVNWLTLFSHKYFLFTFCTRANVNVHNLLALSLLSNLIFMFFMQISYNQRYSSKVSNKLINSQGYYFDSCNCTKHKNRIVSLEPEERKFGLNSTCSPEADWYGSGQHVVSFVLYKASPTDYYHTFDIFIDGIIINAHQMKWLYPGWIIRIYSGVELDGQLCSIACLDEIMWCDVRESTRMGNLAKVNYRMWRFMPLGDPTVNIFISRDLDSLIIERERRVVADWEKSHLTFHGMREDLMHAADLQAGAWGAKNYANINLTELESVRSEMMREGEIDYRINFDEEALSKYIFKRYPNDILVHDSYRCTKEKHKPVPSVPFPMQRKDRHDRVVLSIRQRGYFQVAVCPIECRPSYGQNWTYC